MVTAVPTTFCDVWQIRFMPGPPGTDYPATATNNSTPSTRGDPTRAGTIIPLEVLTCVPDILLE